MNPRGEISRPHLLPCLWACLALLPGCQDEHPDRHADTYLRLLAAALPGPRVPRVASRFPGPPDAVHRGLASRDGSGIDILDLRGCDLKHTVIRERSPLGRSARPSQQLLLALDYLRAAPACSDQLRRQGNHPLADTLDALREDRQRHLPRYLFNATLAGEEFAALWAGRPAPRAFPRVAQPVAVAALAGIDRQARRWLGGDYRAAPRDLELRLGETAGGAAGALLHALSGQAAALAAANHRLRRHADACDTPNRRESARLLAAARRFFLQELQPRFDASLARLVALNAEVTSLERQLDPVLTADYRHWKTRRERRIAVLRQAPSTHLALLARVRQSCAGPGTRRAQSDGNWVH